MPDKPPTGAPNTSNLPSSDAAASWPTESEHESGSTAQVILRELGYVIEPMLTAGRRGEFEAFLKEVGIHQELLVDSGVQEFTDTVEGILEEVGDLQPILEGEVPDVGDVPDLISDVADVFEAMQRLDEVELDAPEFDSLGEHLLDYLLIRYLEDHHRTLHSALALFGVVNEYEDKPDDVDLSVLGQLASDPGEIPKQALGWGTQEFDAVTVLVYLKYFAWNAGVPASMAWPDADELDALADMTDAPEERELRIPIVELEQGVFGVRLVGLPGEQGNALPGLAIVPYGMAAVSVGEEVDLAENWTFNVEVTGSGSFDEQGLAVRPTDGGLDAAMVDLNGGTRNANLDLLGEMGITYDGETDEGEARTIIGDPEASRLAVKSLSVEATVQYDNGEVLLKFALPAKGTIGVHPDSFDGFLQKVLPKDGVFYDFDLVVGWSSQSGLFFERGGTLEVSLPQNTSLGPISMKEIFMRAGPDQSGGAGGGSGGAGGGQSAGGGGGVDASADAEASGDVTVEEGQILIQGAVSGGVTLGPFSATIKRIGVEAAVSFPERKDGNMGAVDLDVGFKPPEGIGLAIEGGPVSGGGYLEFDHENERYAGVLDLQIGKLSLTAVGLLTTRMPDGSDGFSLLVLICAEFPPVQLGFGLTLNGVGGLLGVNRSVKADPLGKAVRAGSLDSVLFPQNPVANAQRIISDLRSIFPPTRATHVFGPMLRIGWGSPTLITGDLGVVLEFPTMKVVLLGRLSAVLPDEEAALIELNLAVMGMLDPPNKSLRIDASLYDSRVVAWTLSGDMALRSSWGDDPRFLLSVGGFNPRYEPPEDFPELRRVTAALGAPGGNPSLTLKGYFALTSNTVQAGAHLRLKAVAGPAKVKGHLGFDALIQFNPFKFVVDIIAALSVKVKGVGLSLKLDGTLSGPTPWRVKGKLHIEILFFEITVTVNAAIGKKNSSEEMPRAKVFPKVVSEFEKPGNWAAQLPDSAGPIASFRDVEAAADEVLAHPLGDLSVRQTVAPLDFALEKFGNAKPTGHTRFDIADAATVGGAALDMATGVTENFAPAQFEKMSDSEKMNSPSFERFAAGRGMRHGGVYPGYETASGTGENTRSGNTRTTTTGYESSVIDRTNDQWSTPLADLGRFATGEANPYVSLPLSQSLSLAAVGNVARADWKRRGNRRFALDDAERAVLVAEQTGVAATLAAESPEATTTPEPGTSQSTPGAGPVGRGAGDVGGTAGGLGGAGGFDSAGGLTAGGSALGGGRTATDDVDYTVVETGTLTEAALGGGGLSKAEARRALKDHESRNPGDAGRFRVVERRKARGTDAGEGEDGLQSPGLQSPGLLLGDGGESR